MTLKNNQCTYDIYCPECKNLLWQQNDISFDKISPDLNNFGKIILDRVDLNFIKYASKINNRKFITYCDIDDTSINETMSKSQIIEMLKKINFFDCIQINGDTFKTIKTSLDIKNTDDLLNYIDCPVVVITIGKKGSTIYHNHNNTIEKYSIINTIDKQIDNTGAGDGFMTSLILSTCVKNNQIQLDIDKLQTISDKLISEILSTIGVRPNNKPLYIKKEESHCFTCGRDL